MCDPSGERGTDDCKIKKQVLTCTHAYFINGSEGAKTILNGIYTPSPAIYNMILLMSTENHFVSLPKLAKQFPFPSDNGNNIGHWQKILSAAEYSQLI